MASKELKLKEKYGGADRDRTDDLLNAIQALSQLSYSPMFLAYGNDDINSSIYKRLFFFFISNSLLTASDRVLNVS
jgi:hypothetical protein